jgi:hypothetical protein
MNLEMRRFIHAYLPDAVIQMHQPYAEYMATLNECDMQVSIRSRLAIPMALWM